MQLYTFTLKYHRKFVTKLNVSNKMLKYDEIKILGNNHSQFLQIVILLIFV